MENKQTIVIDEDLLNKILEVKLEEYLSRKESDIEYFIQKVIRVKIEQEIANTTTIREAIAKELDASNPSSLLSTVIKVKASSAVNSKVVEVPSYQWAQWYKSAIEGEVLKNSAVANMLHPMLTDIIVNDDQFKQTLQGHVELALKAKIEKFLNKSTYSLADELFNQFVEKYKEKRGDL